MKDNRITSVQFERLVEQMQELRAEVRALTLSFVPPAMPTEPAPEKEILRSTKEVKHIDDLHGKALCNGMGASAKNPLVIAALDSDCNLCRQIVGVQPVKAKK